MASLYIVYNSAMATAAGPVKQPTGTAIRTMMQLRPSTTSRILVVEWGCSFDASAAATPGLVELVETDTAATVSSAFAAADIQPYRPLNAIANTAGAGGIPLNLSTTTSGFATASGTENSPAATRMADTQLVAPTNQYVKQWPLGREFEVTAQLYLRVRATFATTVNMLCYVIFEV